MNKKYIEKFDKIKGYRIYLIPIWFVAMATMAVVGKYLSKNLYPDKSYWILYGIMAIPIVATIIIEAKIKCPRCGFKFDSRTRLSQVEYCPKCGERLGYREEIR